MADILLSVDIDYTQLKQAKEKVNQTLDSLSTSQKGTSGTDSPFKKIIPTTADNSKVDGFTKLIKKQGKEVEAFGQSTDLATKHQRELINYFTKGGKVTGEYSQKVNELKSIQKQLVQEASKVEAVQDKVNRTGKSSSDIMSRQQREWDLSTNKLKTAQRQIKEINDYQIKSGEITDDLSKRRGNLTNIEKSLSAQRQQEISANKKSKEEANKLAKEQNKLEKSNSNLIETFKKGIPRMLIWAAGFTIIYSAIRALVNGIKSVFVVYSQLSDEMGHVMTVTKLQGESFTEVHNRMRKAVLDFGSESRASFMDIAKVLYHLGSAGLNAQEQLAGFQHIVKLNIATLGNMDQTARLVAGAYNVFGDKLEGVIGTSQKFKQIADIIAITYKTQQVELTEISSAFGYVASAAGILDVDLMTLVGTIGFLNTGFLKGCFSEDTEILTDKGFKYFKDLDKTELVATLNTETNELEYQNPIRYIDYDYNGKMYKTKTQFLDFLVTPNHNIYVKEGQKRKKTSKYIFKNPNDIFNKVVTYKRNAKWKGNNPKYFELPSVKLNYGSYDEKETGIEKIETKLWIKFLAYFLSEGSASFQKNIKGTNHKVIIYKYQGNKKDKFINDIKKLPFNFFEDDKSKSFGFNNKQLYSYLKPFSISKQYERYIPDFVKNLSPKLLKIFILAYAREDVKIRNKNIEITTNSIKIRDDLQEIGLKAGFATSYHEYKHNGSFKKNHKIWKINISNKGEFNFSKIKNLKDAKKYSNKDTVDTIEEWVDYSGKVYCVEVAKYNTIFVRRNGKTVWSGNSRAGTSLMNAFNQLAQKTDLLKDKFGITFDPRKPLDFNEVMMELHKTIGQQAISTETLRDLYDVFGMRGARAIASILDRWREWKEATGIAKDDFKNASKEMSDIMEKTLPGAWSIFMNTFKKGVQEKLSPVMDMFTSFLNAVNEINKGATDFRKTMYIVSDLFPKEFTPKLFKKDQFGGFAQLVNFSKKHNLNIQNMQSKLKLILDIVGEINTIEDDNVKQKIKQLLLEEDDIKVFENKLNKLDDEYAIKKAIFEISEDIGFDEKIALKDAKEKAYYEKLKVIGLREEKIIEEKIKNWTKEQAGTIDNEEKSRKFIALMRSGEVDTIDKLINASKEYLGNEQGALEYNQLLLDLKKAQLEETLKISNVFKNEVVNGLMNVVKGSQDWLSVIENIRNKLIEMQLEKYFQDFIINPLFKKDINIAPEIKQNSVADELKDVAPEAGKIIAEKFLETINNELNTYKSEESKVIFGGGKSGGKGATGSWETEEISKDLSKGLSNNKFNLNIIPEANAAENGVIFGGGKSGGKGATGSWGSPEALDEISNVSKAKDEIGDFTDSIGSLKDGLMKTTDPLTKVEETLGDIGQGGKKTEGILGKAKDLFGKAGIGNLAQGGLAGAAVGSGGMFGLTGGAGAGLGGILGLASAIPGPVGAIAQGASLIGSLFSAFGKNKKQQEVAQDQTLRITSKIDVTNKELQMVNRNLAGIKRGFEGFILPESAYFRERSEVEARFQLSELRGYSY